MQPIIIEESKMDDITDQAIRNSLCKCFPNDREVFSKTREWHGAGPAWTALVWSDKGDEVIAHAGFVERIINVDGQPVKVAGVQNVFVLPEYRGSGLCDCVIKAGTDYAKEQGFDMGLLFTSTKIYHVYGRCGWQNLLGQLCAGFCG